MSPGEPGGRGERWLLRLGQVLVRIAARRLPRRVRDERYREWTAELPVILHDPDAGRRPQRATRMLGYALDTIRGTTVGPRPARYRGAHSGKPDEWWVPVLVMTVLLLVPLALVALVAFPRIYISYFAAESTSLGWHVSLWVSCGISLARFVIGRRRRAAGLWSSPLPWLSAAGLLIATGFFASFSARDSHWRGGALHAIALTNFALNIAADVSCGVGLLIAARLLYRWAAARRSARQPTGSGSA